MIMYCYMLNNNTSLKAMKARDGPWRDNNGETNKKNHTFHVIQHQMHHDYRSNFKSKMDQRGKLDVILTTK